MSEAVHLSMASSQATDISASEAAALFDRHRLRVARELRGLNQVELAREVGSVRGASISQFEKGHAKPSSATLQRLAIALRVPVAFFIASSRPDHPGTTGGFFRSLRSAPPRERQRALANVELVREITRQLEAFVRLPELDIPSRQNDVTEETTRDAIEKIANDARRLWNLPEGPVDDMVLQLERHGVITTRINVGHAKIDAFSVPYVDRPIVVLCADKNLRDRSRFDAAHELGHLVMHRQQQIGNKVIETQANQFAAAFLMPADEIRSQLPSKADWPTLIRLKAQWHVSIASLLKRAETLEVMGPAAYVQALKIMSVRGWRQNEPGSLGEPERPVLLRRAVEVAASVGVPLNALAQRAGLPEDDVISIISPLPDERPAVDL